MLYAGAEFLTKVIGFPIANPIGAWNHTIIRFSYGIVAAVDARVQVNAAMAAGGSKTDLHTVMSDRLAAFPAVHEMRPDALAPEANAPCPPGRLNRSEFGWG